MVSSSANSRLRRPLHDPIVTCMFTDYVGRVTKRNEFSLVSEPWPVHLHEVSDSLMVSRVTCTGTLYFRATGTTGVNYTAPDFAVYTLSQVYGP